MYSSSAQYSRNSPYLTLHVPLSFPSVNLGYGVSLPFLQLELQHLSSTLTSVSRSSLDLALYVDSPRSHANVHIPARSCSPQTRA